MSVIDRQSLGVPTAKEARKKDKGKNEGEGGGCGHPDSCMSRFAYAFCFNNSRQKFPGAIQVSKVNFLLRLAPIHPREFAIRRGKNIDYAIRATRIAKGGRAAKQRVKLQ